MTQDLRFADLIRALGRGKNGSRSLTREEAEFAMNTVLANQETPAQLGAFLMLMRVKEETAEELAGMVAAVRAELAGWQGAAIDLDWPAYAGKRRQPSWYVLAANTLAQAGYRVLMHGGGEHTPGRQYARSVFQSLALPVADSWAQAQQLTHDRPLVYCALEHIVPKLSAIIDMKAELGLRSPVNTLVRNINPGQARVSLQGMFHPSYQPLHHQTAQQLGDRYNLVLKGDSGEFEVRPDTDQTALIISPGHQTELFLPRRLKRRAVRPEAPSLDALKQLWLGQTENPYGEAAVIGTLIPLLMVLDQRDWHSAEQKALQLWVQRTQSA
ncbi:MAG: glycosyl transferase family protein [Saccharospirillum sp.]